MSIAKPMIRLALLITAIAITALITLFAIPEQPITLNTPGDSVINSVPAIRISLAGKSENSPEPASAPKAMQLPEHSEPKPPVKPKPESEPEPEPEPRIVPEPIPEPEKTPAPTLASTSKKPVHSAPNAPEHSEPVADSTASTAAGEFSPNGQIELNAGTSTAIDNYLSQLSRHLGKFYEYPRRARRLGQEGVPVIVFRFQRDGTLVEHYLQDSSGHELLDKAALDMLKQAAPLPPVPDNMAGQQFSYALPIRFSLR